MSKYLYLSVTPEALIASMLPPAEFGEYMATGTKKSNKGQMIFFEVDLEQVKEIVDVDYIDKRCVRHSDGTPKHSVYLSVYRVLERIPLEALKSLYLTTDNGIVLELPQTPYDTSCEEKVSLHLYQELCPVSPQVASDLCPAAFVKALTDGSRQFELPKLFMVEMKLGELAANPATGSAEHLPYTHVRHLRDCLLSLSGYEKRMKTVVRSYNGSLLYRTVASGFYVGSIDHMIFYRYPSMTELEELNYDFLATL
ncbi:MAG: hypothetical protein WCP08_05170 [Prolixibacteraceae bacterium]